MLTVYLSIELLMRKEDLQLESLFAEISVEVRDVSGVVLSYLTQLESW